MCQALYSAMVRISRVVQSMRHKARGQTVKTRSPVFAEKGLVNQELVVAVLVQAFEAAAIAADAVHARRRVARELDPFRLQRMELRMNHGARKRDRMPAGSVEAPGNQAALRAGFEGGGEPLAIAADRAFAQLGAGMIRRCSARPACADGSPTSRRRA